MTRCQRPEPALRPTSLKETLPLLFFVDLKERTEEYLPTKTKKEKKEKEAYRRSLILEFFLYA